MRPEQPAHDWYEFTPDTPVEGDNQIRMRTDRLDMPGAGGFLLRTLVRVKNGPEVTAVSVATTFIPTPPPR